MWYAHSTSGNEREWQPLAAHLHAVAGLASERASKFGGERSAAVAGLLHDLGKYTLEFQKRLRGGDRVDHATAGARTIIELAGGAGDKALAHVIAHAIAGHHGGMPDTLVGETSLDQRLNRQLAPLHDDWQKEIAPVTDGLAPSFLNSPAPRLAHRLAFLGRMLFSCLVDADFRDTEEFYDRIEERFTPREWKKLPSIVDELIGRFDAHMEKIGAGADETQVNAARRHVLAHVRNRAESSRGLFTLTVPTGGGKTLASLAFALEHARRYNMDRIVYAIPFTSIIDQTASIFREVLEDVGDIVLEHHASIDEERIDDEDRKYKREAREKLKLAMEDWAAPVVVTTNVQLFESLHSNRPSRCRRLHNLANSVIILDEAQTIPLHVLRPCLAAIDELARNYGASVVLCTATQPAVAEPHFKGGLDLPPERELAPEPKRLHEQLKRVRLIRLGGMDDDALVAELLRTAQGLVIVNSRAHALALYRRAQMAGLEGAIHLTTRQCASHRREILADVRSRLKSGAPCRLIATSLVEAGVDLDFPRVWRAETGLDQIAQAAGRCNREGKRDRDDSIVGVFNAPDFPPPHEIKQFADDMARVTQHADLLSPEAISDYFGEVYWRKGAAALDKSKVMDAWAISLGKPIFNYRTVAYKFRMIENGMEPVIIPWDEAAREAVDRLGVEQIPSGALARALQPYIVQTPPKARRLLLDNEHIKFRHPGLRGDQFAVLENASLYKPDVGLLWEDAAYLAEENWLIG